MALHVFATLRGGNRVNDKRYSLDRDGDGMLAGILVIALFSMVIGVVVGLLMA